MHVVSNFQVRPVLSWDELTDTERKDVTKCMDWAHAACGSFVRYKNHVMALSEFQRIVDEHNYWQGAYPLGFSSGYVLRQAEEGVILGTYRS